MKIKNKFILFLLILIFQDANSADCARNTRGAVARRFHTIIPTVCFTASGICAILAARNTYLMNNFSCQGQMCDIISREVWLNGLTSGLLFFAGAGWAFVSGCNIHEPRARVRVRAANADVEQGRQAAAQQAAPGGGANNGYQSLQDRSEAN